MVKKVTALERLLREGYFDSKEAALPYFLSGSVYCGGQKVDTGGRLVDPALVMSVRGLNERYVGKGGYKLEGAIRDFGVEVAGRVCIDAGACTGGFTDCLVQHGAARVYAVEVGYGQLAGKLNQDRRVVNLEKTNLGDPRLLQLDPPPTLGSVDLSYLSLEKAVPQFRAIMKAQGELMCLVKPLFEVEDAAMRRSGEIPADQYLPLLLRLIGLLNGQESTQVKAVTASPVTGNNGTHEFFLHTVFGCSGPPPMLHKQAAAAVERVLALPKYHKN